MLRGALRVEGVSWQTRLKHATVLLEQLLHHQQSLDTQEVNFSGFRVQGAQHLSGLPAMMLRTRPETVSLRGGGVRLQNGSEPPGWGSQCGWSNLRGCFGGVLGAKGRGFVTTGSHARPYS